MRPVDRTVLLVVVVAVLGAPARGDGAEATHAAHAGGTAAASTREEERDKHRPGYAPEQSQQRNDVAAEGLELRDSYVSPVTDADREAAFPDLSLRAMEEHMDDDGLHYFVLGDRVEWQQGQEDQFLWDAIGWIGRDYGRAWWRTEGERTSNGTEQARVEALWGKPIARWWDLVGGVRADLRPDPTKTWVAIGIVGLAPYHFEVEATAYVSGGGDVAAQVEVEYELLLTNRLILQPHLELNAYGNDDEKRGWGSGLSNIEAGLRLRYEFRRELAPYIGVEWGKSYGDAADFARDENAPVEDTRWVVGIRAWY